MEPSKSMLFFSLLIFFAAVISGCAAYKRIPDPASMAPSSREALAHPLYRVIPRHRSQLQPYDIGRWLLWALFGNDDGLFGEETRRYCTLPTYGGALPM